MVVISQWGVTDGDEHHDIQKTLFIFVFQTLLIAPYLGAFISLVVTEATFIFFLLFHTYYQSPAAHIKSPAPDVVL